MSTGPSTTFVFAERSAATCRATPAKSARPGAPRLFRAEPESTSGRSALQLPWFFPFSDNRRRPALLFRIFASVISGKSVSADQRQSPPHDPEFDTQLRACLRPAGDRLRRTCRRMTANNPEPVHLSRHQQLSRRRRTRSRSSIPDRRTTAHFDALLEAIARRPVSHIFVSHTHRDHSPLAARLKERTGRDRAGRGAASPGAAAAHRRDQPARRQRRHRLSRRTWRSEGDTLVDGDGWAIRTVLTPGHTANHAAFALEGTGTAVFGRSCDGAGRPRSWRRRTARWPTTWPRSTG